MIELILAAGGAALLILAIVAVNFVIFSLAKRVVVGRNVTDSDSDPVFDEEAEENSSDK